jgi:hypothetical protein
MSAAEIKHRVSYKLAVQRERRAHASGTLLAPDRLVAAFGSLAADRGALARRRREQAGAFFPSVRQREAFAALFDTRYAFERAAIGVEAAKTRTHRFEFFGHTFEYPADIAWQADPVSGRSWPALFHADVPVHKGDTGFGDVKHVWELSRQQFLVDLGKAWFITGDRESVAAMQALVRSWIAGNPYATGVNWACALEPAFRVFSWLWSYHLTLDAIDDDFHAEWLEALIDHGRFIETHLELYSSPYNHLVAEAAALYGLAASLPETAHAARWRAKALDVLVGRLPQQFYADGGSVEQSTFYHHATIGFYLFAALIGRAANDDFPAPVWAAIEHGLEYSLALAQPDGFTPPIGGADDGKPIRMEHLPFWDFRPYLAMGAVLFNRPDFKAVAGRFYEDALWMLGTAGLESFDAMPESRPTAMLSTLPASGYFVLRSGWQRTDSYVCFDCGEQAAGMRPDAIPNSMHGHADCLSLCAVWLSGTRVLVDSGLFAYNCGGEWEAHFRRTAAHNTAMIDGRDQATHLGKMAWAYSYVAHPEGAAAGSWGAWAAGSHDGFRRLGSGVTHRRRIWLRPAGYLAVLDEFETADTRHDLDLHWQFAPGVLTPAGPASWAFDGTTSITVLASQPIEGLTAAGGERPHQGWIAPSLGVRTPAPRLTIRASVRAPVTRILTLIARDAVVQSRSTDRETFVATIRGDGWTDIVCAAASGAGLGPAAPLHSDAPLAICHSLDGAPPAAWAMLDATVEMNLPALAPLIDRA